MIFYITGFMGAGKSGIGREAAKRAGVRFVDMDREIERIHGMSVAEIFARVGERVFRKSERTVLEELSRTEGDLVVSAGGGTPCEGDNMELMNATGKTIYLKLTPSKLIVRIMPGQHRRPKLAGMDEGQVLDYIRQTLPGREEYYMQATMVVDCDALSDESITNYVAEYIRYHREAEAGGGFGEDI